MIAVTVETGDFLTDFMAQLALVERDIGQKVKAVVFYIDGLLHERMPVYTGLAVRNIQWNQGGPTGEVFDAIPDPLDTGRTSQMALGSEPRRAANEQASRESLMALDFDDPFTVFTVTDYAPDAELIESGSSGLPGGGRAPAGVFGITAQDALAFIAELS